MVFAPAAALGATFPMAVRWFASDSRDPARQTGVLYAVNTTGAAIGALVAGFVMIPWIGVSGTTRVGIAASALAALSVLALIRFDRSSRTGAIADPGPKSPRSTNTRARRSGKREAATSLLADLPAWLPSAILGVSGFAALIHEIAWTRILSLVLGPTIYAFAATVAAVIAGVAIGSAIGTWISARAEHRLTWLMVALIGAALSNGWTSLITWRRRRSRSVNCFAKALY
jgi:spermidine synthase